MIPGKPGTEPLAEAIKACRPHFGWAAVFSALVNLLYLTPTLYMMQVYDRVVPTGGVPTLLLVSAIAVFALATLALLDWLRTRLLVRAGLRLDRLLVSRLLGRVVDLQAHSPGSQALREFDHVRSAVSGQGTLALFDVPWTPIYIGCCFLLHPALGALTLAGGIVLFVLAVLNERDSRPRLTDAMKEGQAAYAAQESMAAQSEVVRALGMRQAGIALQVRQRQIATQRQAEAQFTGGRYTGIIKFLRLMLQSAALGLAAYLTVNGEISAGSIIAASVLLTRAVQPIEQMVGAWPTLMQARSSWKSLLQIFASTARVDRELTTLPPPEGRLSLEQVTVRLPGAQTTQLKGVTLTLEPGQVLGVIGPSGSGKTTLARVVAGAITPTSGSVRLDGADYDAREGDRLAEYIGYLPQVPGLFAGTVKDNISRFQSALGAPAEEVDREAIAAAQAAGVHEMILRLPEGYDTRLGPNGAGLSVGQSQRVALARALYRNPVVLVLDEPNANLDQEGETALVQAIRTATARGTTVIMVAHRAGVLGIADRLLMLKDGVPQMEGARDEVLARLNPGRTRPTVVPPPGARSA
nr:type I secretion system permease/ATPase [Brevundimonas sp. A19_0]